MKWLGSKASDSLLSWGGPACGPQGSRVVFSAGPPLPADLGLGAEEAGSPASHVPRRDRSRKEKAAAHFLFSYFPRQLWLTVQPKNKPPL